MNAWESTVTFRTLFLWGIAVTTGLVAASVLQWATPGALLAVQTIFDKVAR
ncbi:hypothetical protein M4951_22225 [Blastopirellula sp. J2-11]|uniref:hypothetical protein n=1 Tax=Blastopirellula sp. J2-11 TaxID=2943192 RepID=UPI0021C88D01|nr:hypothetical protein [Blastopirellula sp. J2-11]UUO06065.1 hypothetical protein M4951_22225 [Blastopirellula sp. J2-11]